MTAELGVQALLGAWVVDPRGRVGIVDAQPLRERFGALLTDGSVAWVVCDLDGLTAVDVLGLGVLLRAHHLARRNHRQFCITGGSWQVRRSLDLAGLREKLAYYPPLARALDDAANVNGSVPLRSTPNCPDTTDVEDAEDRHAIRGVTERLHKRFPDIEPQIIDAAVQDVYSALREAPIRAFVPMLVEREARDRLRDGRQA